MQMNLPWTQRTWLDEWVPYLLPFDKDLEIIKTAVGGLLMVAQIEPPDLETESPEAVDNHHDRLVEAFAQYGRGWSVYIDQWRTHAPGYLPASTFGGCYAAQAIDASRRRQFMSRNRPVFRNTNFIAIHYVPQQRDAWLAWMMDRDDPQVAAQAAFFREHAEGLLQLLAQSMRSVTVLRGDDLASYLSATITFEPHRVMMPIGALAPQLATREWQATLPLAIDKRHIGTVELRNFGNITADAAEVLHGVPFECRWTTAFHGLDPDERRREIGELRKRWEAKLRGVKAILTEVVTKNPFAARRNPEAEQALVQLDVMEAELAYRPFALAHANVHVWADRERRPGETEEDAAARATYEVEQRAGQVASLLKGRGFEARVATLNNVFAPLADMPGNVSEDTQNIRRLRVELSAVTRAAPVTGVIEGSREDWRFSGPALLVGTTRRGVPLYWSMNAAGSDSAHTAIIGKTGSGKSTILALMAAQFLRYEGARTIVFDRRRSFMVPCLAMGGDWIELGGGGKGVQPLRAIHIPAEFAWAQDWLLRALIVRGLKIEPHIGSALADALSHVADLPENERTLTRLHTFLSDDGGLRQALSYYLNGRGPYGELFDGVVPSYGEAAVMGIETQDIIQLTEAAPLVISAVFRAMQRDRLTGDAPKLVVIDEAWSLLQSELFASEIESWAREMRKLKAALVLSTQSLADLQTDGARVIFDQVTNRLYLPHAEALRPQTRELYEGAGLTEDQVRLIAAAQPKGEYLLQTEEVTRLVTIRLEDDAKALCGASTPADHGRAWALLAQGIQPGEEFARAWLSQTTTEWAAEQRLKEAA